ncbi:MAG: hypothetical protein ACYDB7_12955, partial [Mycobacteriales bacterium]
MSTTIGAPVPAASEPDDDETALPSAFSDLFTRAAKRVGFGADRSATMADVRTVSLVETGALDLFAVDLGQMLQGEALLPHAGAGTAGSGEGGRASARWTFLTRVEAGTMLVGAPTGPRHTVFGRPLPGTRVSRVPMATLQALFAPSPDDPGPAGRERVAAQDAGLVALSAGVREEHAPPDFAALDSG